MSLFAPFLHANAQFTSSSMHGGNGAHVNWSMILSESAATVNRATLRALLALCRRFFGAEHYRYPMTGHFKPVITPMVHYGRFELGELGSS